MNKTNRAAVDSSQLYTQKQSVRRLNTHSFQQLQYRTEVYKSSFLPATIVDWNALSSQAISSHDITPDHVDCFTRYVRNKVFQGTWRVRGKGMSRDVLRSRSRSLLICDKILKINLYSEFSNQRVGNSAFLVRIDILQPE